MMSLVNVELRAKMIYLLMMWLSSKKSTLIAEQNLFLYAPFHFIVNFDLILGGFFFICRGKWPISRSVQGSKLVFALHRKLNNFYLLCFIQLWILILTLFWGWGNMALQAQNMLFWKSWSGSKTVLGDSWYRLISFVFWVWLNLDSYHTVLSSCVWWMVPSNYLVSTQLQFWGFVVGAATKMS